MLRMNWLCSVIVINVTLHLSAAITAMLIFYAPPSKSGRKRNGRPRTKGRKLQQPQQLVAQRKSIPATVSWYGGSDRKVELTGDTGQWYKAGKTLLLDYLSRAA